MLAQCRDLGGVAAIERRQRGKCGIGGGHRERRLATCSPGECDFSTRRASARVRAPTAHRRASRRREGPMRYTERVRFGLPLVLKLIATLTSPYARKVRIALAEKKIEYALVEDSPWVPGNAVSELNPLGKIPVLVLDDGTRVFDSRVIVEYLDAMSPVSRLIPEPSRQRIAVKRWEALADGICDAAGTIFLERKRPVRQQSKDWIARQRTKIDLGVRRARGGTGRARMVQRRGVLARRHRHRLHARLSRPAFPRDRLARRASESRGARREARRPAELRGHGSAGRLNWRRRQPARR